MNSDDRRPGSGRSAGGAGDDEAPGDGTKDEATVDATGGETNEDTSTGHGQDPADAGGEDSTDVGRDDPARGGVPDAASPPGPWPAELRLPAIAACGLLGGVLYGLHVRHTGLWPLAWISTAPWLLLMVHPRLQGRFAFLGYLGGVYVGWLIGIEWVRAQSTSSWLIGPLFYFPFALIAWPSVRLVRRHFPAFPLALLWALAFTATEWLRLRFSPGELAVWVLGYSQITRSKLVQVADVGGVAMVSFLLAAAAGFAVELVLAATTPEAAVRRRRLVLQAAGIAALTLAYLGYGAVRDTEEHFSEGPTLHVLQADLPHGRDPEVSLRIYHLHVLQTLSTARPGETDAILWPENSILMPYIAKGRGLQEPIASDLLDLARRVRQPILVDGGSYDPETRLEFHTAALVSPDGEVQSYDKVRLLPWAEYVPARNFFHRVGALGAWERFIESFMGHVPAASLGALDELAPFELTARDSETYSFGTPICFEIATARVVNAWHRQGVDFLVNQTSEGLLGDSIHAQTVTVSGFRAIEGRVSVIRAANEGISALIDPNGRVKEVLAGRTTGSAINEGGVFYPTVILDDRAGKTLYVRFGDWFSVACALFLAALVAAAVLRGRRARAASAG